MSSEKGPTVAKVGNICKEDPVLRFSKDGKPFTNFSLQVKPWVPQGQPKPEATYYEVTSFGSLAEHVATSLRRGDRVVVFGEGKIESWTDQKGNEKKTKKIIADGLGPDLRFTNATLTDDEDEKPKVPAAQASSADEDF